MSAKTEPTKIDNLDRLGQGEATRGGEVRLKRFGILRSAQRPRLASLSSLNCCLRGLSDRSRMGRVKFMTSLETEKRPVLIDAIFVRPTNWGSEPSRQGHRKPERPGHRR
jgi:hypothetical protein